MDGTVYTSDTFIDRLREYHVAAKLAHEQHSKPTIPIPMPEFVPSYVVTIPDTYLGGNGNGNGTAYGTATGGADEPQDTIGWLGSGSGNGSNGPLGAPTYDPPSASDGPEEPEGERS